MKRVGAAGIVSSTYGVQVKSGDAAFHYSGEHLIDWIKAYNIPIIMCRANRDRGNIQLYSTWPLHHLILSGNGTSIQQIDFIEEYGNPDELRMPEVKDNKATVWVGKPIIAVSVNELKEAKHVNEIVNTLAEWVNFDADNCFRSRSNIPVIFGYITWETNKSLETSWRKCYKLFHYSDDNSHKAIKVIQDCAAVIAFNMGKDNPITKDLAEFIKKYGIDLEDFTKTALGI